MILLDTNVISEIMRPGRDGGAVLDALIAAIALANSMTLAPRNTADFADIGLSVINPFETAVG